MAVLGIILCAFMLAIAGGRRIICIMAENKYGDYGAFRLNRFMLIACRLTFRADIC